MECEVNFNQIKLTQIQFAFKIPELCNMDIILSGFLIRIIFPPLVGIDLDCSGTPNGIAEKGAATELPT